MFFKKDMLLLLRDWKGLVVLLVSPLVLILILGFATRGLNESEPPHIKAALVEIDNAQDGLQQFLLSLEERSLSEEEQAQMETAAHDAVIAMQPQQMLRQVDVRELVSIKEMEAEAARKALAEEEVDVILTLPLGYTLRMLERMLLGVGDGEALIVTAGNSSQMLTGIFEHMIEDFSRSLSFHSAVSQALGSHAADGQWSRTELPLGGLDQDANMKVVSTFQYYTFSMAVLFVLFVSSNTAGRAFAEKQQRVYDRIILAQTPPLRYLVSKAAAAALLAWLQLCILFALSHVVLGVFPGAGPRLWLGLGLISFVLAICVGALAALLTAVNFRYNNPSVSLLFTGIGITLMAIIGGSMGPLASMPNWLTGLAVWTPNGLSLSLFIQWAQGAAITSILPSLSYFLIASIMMLGLSALVFPGRRRA